MLAPATMIALTALLGWRGALIAAGALAFVVLGAMLAGAGVLRDEAARERREESRRRRRRPAGGCCSSPLLLLFLFYVLSATFTSGVQTFSVTALNGVGAPISPSPISP